MFGYQIIHLATRSYYTKGRLTCMQLPSSSPQRWLHRLPHHEEDVTVRSVFQVGKHGHRECRGSCHLVSGKEGWSHWVLRLPPTSSVTLWELHKLSELQILHLQNGNTTHLPGYCKNKIQWECECFHLSTEPRVIPQKRPAAFRFLEAREHPHAVPAFVRPWKGIWLWGCLCQVTNPFPTACSVRLGLGAGQFLLKLVPHWDLPTGGAGGSLLWGEGVCYLLLVGGSLQPGFTLAVGLHPCSHCWLWHFENSHNPTGSLTEPLWRDGHQETSGAWLWGPSPELHLGISCSSTRPDIPDIYHLLPSPGCGHHLPQALLLCDLSVPVSACWVFQCPCNQAVSSAETVQLVFSWLDLSWFKGVRAKGGHFLSKELHGFSYSVWEQLASSPRAWTQKQTYTHTHKHKPATCLSQALGLLTTGFQTQIRNFVQSAAFVAISINPNS